MRFWEWSVTSVDLSVCVSVCVGRMIYDDGYDDDALMMR